MLQPSRPMLLQPPRSLSSGMGSAKDPQRLLSAGALARSPAASAGHNNRVVTVWWPPSATTVMEPSSQPREQPPASSFSAESQRIVDSLGMDSVAAATRQSSGGGTQGGGDSCKEARTEQLRHPIPVVSLQWSPGGVQSGGGLTHLISNRLVLTGLSL